MPPSLDRQRTVPVAGKAETSGMMILLSSPYCLGTRAGAISCGFSTVLTQQAAERLWSVRLWPFTLRRGSVFIHRLSAPQISKRPGGMRLGYCSVRCNCRSRPNAELGLLSHCSAPLIHSCVTARSLLGGGGRNRTVNTDSEHEENSENPNKEKENSL